MTLRTFLTELRNRLAGEFPDLDREMTLADLGTMSATLSELARQHKVEIRVVPASAEEREP